MKAKKIFVFILVFVFSICFCACEPKNNTPINDNQSKIETSNSDKNFLVTVVDDNGDAVEGVILRIYKDVRINARTNSNGIAKFPLIITDGYKLYVLHCPDGYEYTGVDGILIKKGTQEFILNIKKVGDKNETK